MNWCTSAHFHVLSAGFIMISLLPFWNLTCLTIARHTWSLEHSSRPTDTQQKMVPLSIFPFQERLIIWSVLVWGDSPSSASFLLKCASHARVRYEDLLQQMHSMSTSHVLLMGSDVCSPSELHLWVLHIGFYLHVYICVFFMSLREAISRTPEGFRSKSDCRVYHKAGWDEEKSPENDAKLNTWNDHTHTATHFTLPQAPQGPSRFTQMK